METQLIATQDTSSAKKDGSVVNYRKGQRVGYLNENLNDGTYLINNRQEIVNAESVAIVVQTGAVIQSNKNVSVVSKKQISLEKIKKIVSIAILSIGVFMFYKGKKGLGICLIVSGLYLVKINFLKTKLK